METILYVGGFELPDRNAAAQRVVGIAKGAAALGHEVIFMNYSACSEGCCWTEYFGFPCYEQPPKSLVKSLTDITDVQKILKEKHITAVIAYNYPAYALSLLIRYCRREGIRCYADATEWYMPRGNPLFLLVKTLDTEWRMRVLHKKMDGVLAISDYLYEYYRKVVRTVKIPPTVDMEEAKWLAEKKPADKTTFVYAGSPSSQKERLDLVIDSMERICKIRPVQLKLVGITKAQYEKMYHTCYRGRAVLFCGRISHQEAINTVKKADWSIVFRDNNKVVKAGFPTKVVESIACGTPVIANRFSNIDNFLKDDNSILCDPDKMEEAILYACDTRKNVDTSIFDYHLYLQEIERLLKKV